MENSLLFKIGEGLAILFFAMMGAYQVIFGIQCLLAEQNFRSAVYIGAGIVVIAMAIKRI